MKDELLAYRLMDEDEEFRRLMEEHIKFEKILEEFNKKPYLTQEEYMEKKRIQKLKLAGKDRMEAILEAYKKRLRNHEKQRD